MKKQKKTIKLHRKRTINLRGEKKNLKQKNKRKIISIIAASVLLIAGAIAAAIIIPREIEKQRNIELRTKLDKCLDSKDNDDYDARISCYKTYPVKGYEKSVSNLNTEKKKQNLTNCISNAQKNSEVTDEELQKSKYDATLAVALIARIGNGYQEEINCYEKYGTSADDARVSELRSKKAENDSYLESAKNAATSTPNSGSGSYSTHCATHAIGNYVYTDCY